MNRISKLEERNKAETIAPSDCFTSAAQTLHANPSSLSREEQFKELVKAKIFKGLDDIATGRIVSQEEFHAEIKGRGLRKL